MPGRPNPRELPQGERASSAKLLRPAKIHVLEMLGESV